MMQTRAGSRLQVPASGPPESIFAREGDVVRVRVVSRAPSTEVHRLGIGGAIALRSAALTSVVVDDVFRTDGAGNILLRDS